MVLLALLIWFIQLSFSVSAAGAPYQNDPRFLITTWETEDGLPENSATAMVQTADGYLWFGTFGGLVRFDGVHFEVFDPSNTPGLPSGGIVNLHLDKRQRLWISTYGGMAVMSDGECRTLGRADGWVGDFARTFAERDNGDLLVTTFDGYVLEFRDGRFHELPSPPGAPGQGYFGHVDEEGRWWVVQNRFVGWWDGERWAPMTGLPVISSEELGCGRAADGGMWLLWGRTLRKICDGREVSRIELPEDPGSFWAMAEDGDGNVWICSHNRGLSRVSPDGRMEQWNTSNGLRHDGVRFIFEDRERNLWVGTSGGGLNQFRPRRFQAFGTHNGLNERVVTSVAARSAGGAWVGTYGGGVYHADEDRATQVDLPGEGDGLHVQSVLEDRAGRLWIGIYGGGLWMFDGEQLTKLPTDQMAGANPLTLFEDSRGRIWVDGGQGFAVADPEKLTLRRFGEEDGIDKVGVYSFAERRDGEIWAAHRGGIFRQPMDDERFQPVLTTNGKAIEGVQCLLSDADGSVWMGTTDRGLLRWRDGRLSHFDHRAGLPRRVVLSMMPDKDGFLWMATSGGVMRVDFSSLRAAMDGGSGAVAANFFDGHDGLPTVELTGGRQPMCAKDGRGRIWFATHRGAAVIDPRALRLNDAPPPTHIQRVTFFVPASEHSAAAARRRRRFVERRVEAPHDAPLELPAGSRRLEIRFAGLSYAAPEKVQYQVRLREWDVDWQDVGNARTAYYHDLPPGEYTFEVRAANHDGVWNETGANLAFSVQPFYWQTFWFRGGIVGLVVLSSAGTATWLTRWRFRQRKQFEQRFRAVVEAAPSAMVVVDKDGVIKLVNRQTEAIFAHDRADLIGQPVEMLVAAGDREAYATLRDRFLADRKPRELGKGRELHGRRKNGETFPMEIGLSPVRLSSAAAVASIVDITDRKAAEREATRQRNELAHLSRVTMLGELSGSLAHELNQPLAAILSNAQAAQRFLSRGGDAELDEIREILDDIVNDDRRAGEVIRRLRLLLKKGEIQLQPLDLNEVVLDVLKLMHSDLIDHGARAHTDLADALPAVSGDRVQLQQVMLNLLRNACDAMADTQPGTRDLYMRTFATDEDSVCLEVADRGGGIAPDNQKRLFEPFFTTKRDGLGMGLAVCRTIIEAHGGRLWAENNTEGGATFRFTLPAMGDDA